MLSALLFLLMGAGLVAGDEPQRDDKSVRKDQQGDPLPPGVLLRFGTTRLRHGSWVDCAAFSPDSKTLVSGGSDRTIRLWEVATGREIWHYLGQERAVYSVAFSPNGKMVASGSADSTI